MGTAFFLMRPWPSGPPPSPVARTAGNASTLQLQTAVKDSIRVQNPRPALRQLCPAGRRVASPFPGRPLPGQADARLARSASWLRVPSMAPLPEHGVACGAPHGGRPRPVRLEGRGHRAPELPGNGVGPFTRSSTLRYTPHHLPVLPANGERPGHRRRVRFGGEAPAEGHPAWPESLP